MGAGPWSQEQIDAARVVRFSAVLDHLGAYSKIDSKYEALDPGRRSKRVQVSYQGRDFRFIFTGEKFVNELRPESAPQRGGGGAIDFVRHVTRCNFVQAVKVCLDALKAQQHKA
jgi:hypothetical protein